MNNFFKSSALNLLFLFLFTHSVQAANTSGLENQYLKAEFNDTGITGIYDKKINKTINLKERPFRLKIDGETIDGAAFDHVTRRVNKNTVLYKYKNGEYEIEVRYELEAGWHFVSKQLFILAAPVPKYRVQDVDILRGKISNLIYKQYLAEGGKYGAFLRIKETPNESPIYGVFFALQNPFMDWKRDHSEFSVKYHPAMDWKEEYGSFKSDRAFIGTYKLSGQDYPAGMVPEWKYAEDTDELTSKEKRLDYSEIEALTDCVEQFLLYKPDKSLHIQVGWTLNDYQIDVATEKGRKTYKRIIRQAASLGANYLLYTPANSDLSSLEQNRDAWGWENVLWLGLGQKIRKGEWKPDKDPVPDKVRQMINYASKQGVGLIAYVYPTMPWLQNPKWTAWVKGKPGGYLGADTGIRSFQNWFINLLIEFYKKTGIRGYSFDHWWIRYDQPGTTSQYAQWYGTRRILETLRKRIPNIVIDGRQQYYQMGPWTWLAGSYPHPLASDEQPQSFEAFPDLSWDRVSADRQRYAAWWYRMKQFTPIQIMPGYMTHQTQRFNKKGKLVRSDFRSRDWDYMGWKYSVLSAIGTAPFNQVIDYIPARDLAEVKNFSDRDKRWFIHWLYWPNKHIKYMRKLRPIIGQPMVGRVDGSSAIIDDNGFVFLFNPNYRAMDGMFKLDQSIGLKSGKKFVIKTLYPSKEGYIGAPSSGLWRYGQRVRLHMEGTQAQVLQIIPADEIKKPIMLNAKGEVTLKGNKIVVKGMTGPMGHRRKISFVTPSRTQISSLVINGRNVPFKSQKNILTTDIAFDGMPFDHSQQIGKYDPTFTGGTYTAHFRVPQRIFDQLQNRRKMWSIPYTPDDLKATWLGPSRFLLFVQIADPKQDMDVSMEINGETIKLQPAYSSVYAQPNVTQRTFLGYYVNLTSIIKADKKYVVKVHLPKLDAGQFQGLFFQNIKTEYTNRYKVVKD